jgi:hypothetical protein
VEEMNAAAVLTSERDGFERFIRHCSRYRKIAPRKYPRGVFKFQSLEEAQAARQHIENLVLESTTETQRGKAATKNSS